MLTRTLIFTACLIPGMAWAEGAHRYFDCTVTRVCNAEGLCEPASETLTFHLEPQEVDDDGSGLFIIRYQDTEASMQALSEAGPFYWTTENERHTLLISSESDFLWHHLQLGTSPAATIHYLHCGLRF